MLIVLGYFIEADYFSVYAPMYCMVCSNCAGGISLDTSGGIGDSSLMYLWRSVSEKSTRSGMFFAL
jgi:hypothetical protein